MVAAVGLESGMDFNHPMAGVDLFFSGHVQSVRDADPTELLCMEHAHGEGGHHH